MADKEAAPAKGWFKTVFGMVGGLLSGAAAMYVTAAFNQVVKPAKPVANFKYDATGLNVRFQNLSGGGQGFWDFGDGSALEPVSEREFVDHAYPRTGDYTAKLSLHNILGEEAERSVSVHLDPQGTVSSSTPEVASLEAVPISPNSYAPATFRLVSKVKNAQLCVLDCGDERPLEVLTDPSAASDRLVTFHEPGGHVVKLLAINGSKLDHKTEIVNVEEPPMGTLSVMLTVTDKATRVESRTRTAVIALNGQADAAVADGFRLTDVSVLIGATEVGQPGQTTVALDGAAVGKKGAKNLQLTIAPDRGSVKLTGEAPRDSRGQPQQLTLLLKLSEQRSLPAGSDGVAASSTMTLPGAGQHSGTDLNLPPVPADWKNVQRGVRLKLLDGDAVVWEGAGLPKNTPIAVGKRRCVLNASATNGLVHIDLLDRTGSAPAGN